jgi:hypothetical protein
LFGTSNGPILGAITNNAKKIDKIKKDLKESEALYASQTLKTKSRIEVQDDGDGDIVF